MDASASRSVRFEQFGFTPDRVVAAAHATLDRVGKISSTISGT
jgi:transketolase